MKDHRRPGGPEGIHPGPERSREGLTAGCAQDHHEHRRFHDQDGVGHEGAGGDPSIVAESRTTTIRFRGSVPVSRLKASARKFKKKKGTAAGCRWTSPASAMTWLSSLPGRPAGAATRSTGPGMIFPSVFVGPVGFRTRFKNSRALKQRLKQAGDEAAAADT